MAGECTHENVTWEPLQFEYDCEGMAEVWQNGRCDECGKSLQVDYSAGESRIDEGNTVDPDILDL